jgi:putative oxidoreductase
MLNKFFLQNPNLQQYGLVTIRIITGWLMIYHGIEIFNSDTMKMYLEWDVIKTLPLSNIMPYLGKSIELITGILFVLGLFTRVAALFMAGNMLFICFYIGSGKFYYEDQHPFLFAALALIFLFTGSVKFGLDNYLLRNSND